MWIKIFLPVFTFSLILADISPLSANPAGEARILESELLLAKANDPYLLIDTGAGLLSFRAKGVKLREWKVPKSGKWGFPFVYEPLQLVKKSTLIPPEREEIRPGQPEAEDNFDIQALELQDMPTSFSLVLGEDITVFVKPSQRGFGKPVSIFRKVLRRLFFYPLATIKSSIQGRDYHVLEIEMESAAEAQSLYWALTDKTSFLIYKGN